MLRLFSSAALVISLLSSPALAQAKLNEQQRATNIVTLAGILGQAHSIRVMCNGRSDQYWRDFMSEMLDHEAPEQNLLRTRIIEAFNSGYASEQARNVRCTADAVLAESSYAASGRRLSQGLLRNYLPAVPQDTQSEE